MNSPFLAAVEATTAWTTATLTTTETIAAITKGIATTVVIASRLMEGISTTATSIPAAACGLIQGSASTLIPPAASTSVP
jgi:hypothetical protein